MFMFQFVCWPSQTAAVHQRSLHQPTTSGEPTSPLGAPTAVGGSAPMDPLSIVTSSSQADYMVSSVAGAGGGMTGSSGSYPPTLDNYALKPEPGRPLPPTPPGTCTTTPLSLMVTGPREMHSGKVLVTVSRSSQMHFQVVLSGLHWSSLVFIDGFWV